MKAFRGADVIAKAGENLHEGICRVFMIVDQKNPEWSSGRKCCSRPLSQGGALSPRRRYRARYRLHSQGHCRTMIRSGAIGGQCSTMRVYDRFGNSQAQTESTLSFIKLSLALLEGIENSR